MKNLKKLSSWVMLILYLSLGFAVACSPVLLALGGSWWWLCALPATIFAALWLLSLPSIKQ